jgi:glycosyltransferase involved in cell wall biosynthesis
LKIAITADPEIPVPPVFYGGIERIIDLLITEHVSNGHHVTLFAHKDSIIGCNLVPYKSTGNKSHDVLQNTWTISKNIFRQKFDIVHSFGRLAYLLPLLPSTIPKLMSYQREPTIAQIKKAVKLAKNGSLAFTGCSNYITDQISPYADAFTVYNGVNIDKYKATNTVKDDAPLVFLGRIEPIKGTHTAVEIALRTEKKLIIAGNIPKEHSGYFDQKIKPFLSEKIKYIGPVNDHQKAALLQQALALLMPIHWNEPFGIVVIEAMAAGTPVLGFQKGALPEIIQHGRTGFIAETTDELVSYVKLIETTDRRRVRKSVEEKFSAPIIADRYSNIYRHLIDKNKINGKK